MIPHPQTVENRILAITIGKIQGLDSTSTSSRVPVERLDRLTGLANQYARPWKEFFPDLSKNTPEGWYHTYQQEVEK